MGPDDRRKEKAREGVRVDEHVDSAALPHGSLGGGGPCRRKLQLNPPHTRTHTTTHTNTHIRTRLRARARGAPLFRGLCFSVAPFLTILEQQQKKARRGVARATAVQNASAFFLRRGAIPAVTPFFCRLLLLLLPVLSFVAGAAAFGFHVGRLERHFAWC